MFLPFLCITGGDIVHQAEKPPTISSPHEMRRNQKPGQEVSPTTARDLAPLVTRDLSGLSSLIHYEAAFSTLLQHSPKNNYMELWQQIEFAP